MSIDIPLELDTGPITWVKPEIEASLARVLSGIAASRERIDPEVKKSIARELHTVAGAFELVGVEGLSVLVREFETHFSAPSQPPSVQALEQIERGVRRLLAHLQEIAAGAPAVPIRFLPEYLALGKLRDARLGPADLFFPDLSRKPAKAPTTAEIPPGQLPALLMRKRREFQQGLLVWLRGGGDGLALMGGALKSIEEAFPLPAQRSFWWSTRALIRAVEKRLLEPSVALKQLLARVDLQIRRFAEGSTRVADRLRREVLYHLARSDDGDPLVDEVKALYELGVLIPKRVPIEIDYVAIQPALERLGQAVARAKERWGASLGAARERDREEFVTAVDEIAAQSKLLGHADFKRLGESLAETVHGLGAATPSDDLSIEIASTLILIETAASQIASLPRNFPAQVDTTIQRLAYARKGIAIPSELRNDADADSLTRKAQERATIAQVVREIRTNMRAVEQALDAAFRDRSAVDELAPVPGLLAQVSGALQILGWTRANDILSETSSRLLQGIQSEQPLDDKLINEYADTLAGISFYIDAKEQRESEAEAMLDALERRARGEPAESARHEDQSVEASIAGHRRQLRESLELAAEPSGADSAREAVLAIKHDAELLADTRLLGAANNALAAIDQGKPDAAAVTALLAASDASVPVPEASPESQRLAKAQDDERDSLLLEIFCEEAVEVVSTLKEGVSSLVSAAGDRDALVTVRRAFHTLKGSGRMVGLTDFGEAAWQIERVLNGVLESDRAPLPHEVALMNAATRLFDRWVGDLKATGRADVDVGAITRLVAACERREMPPDGWAASAPRDVAPAPTTVGPGVVAAEAPVIRLPQTDAPPPGGSPIAFAPVAEPLSSIAESAPAAAPLPTLDFVPPSIPDAPSPPPIVPEPHSASPVSAEPVGAPATATESADEPISQPEVIELPASAWTLEDENVVVEGVTVPRTLFSILVDESRAHLQTLEQELALLQFDPAGVPSESMVRAAHTLCGIHRTAGFTNIGDLAAETESALVALSGAARDGEAYAVIASAIAVLRTASLRIQTQTAMREEERRAFGQALVAMRGLNARLGARTRDAVAAAMAATRDEATAPSSTLDPLAVTETGQSTDVPLAASPVELTSVGTGFEPPAPASSTAPADVSLVAPITSPAAEPTPPPAPEASALAQPDVHEPQPAASVLLEPVAPPSETAAAPTSVAQAPAPVATEPAPTPTAPPAVTTPTPTVASPAPTASAAVTPLGMAAATLAGAATLAPTVLTHVEADSADPLADVRDEVDEQVMPLFLEEAQELFPAATEQARMMRAAPADASARAAIKRTLHTLKGSARMAGAMRLGEITHLLETRIIEAPTVPAPAFFDAVDEALDDVAFLLDRHSRGEHNVVLPRFRPEAIVEAAEDAIVVPTAEATSPPKAVDAPLAAAAPTAAPSPTFVQPVAPVVPAAAVAAVAAPAGAPLGTATAPAETAFLRVRSDALETLADEAGEIAIARARIESELRDLKTGLLDLTSAVIRLRSQLREIEIQGESQIQSRLDTESAFDPLEFDRYTRFQELTRGLAEGVNDVATVQQNLLKNLADADASLAAQMRLSRSVQLRLQSMRTVPFATLSDRLYRVLRQTAKELGKRANLDIRGGRIEIDRSVLERLAPVLEHLVRNALAHGIEPVNERERVGKSATGEMGLAVTQQGNEVVIELTDDGAGLPLAKIEARARALGMLAPDAQVSEAELVELIFQTGFSTAETVSAIAGRGVGMDVVRSEVTALGGRVEVRTQAGRGTTFVLRVPLTLAVTQVLLVRTGDTAVGIPASLIETVRQVRTTECDAARASGNLLHAGKQVPYFVLSPLYDKTPIDVTDHRTRSVAILRSGDLVAAFELEAVIGNQEVVAKPYGPQLARVRGLAGLTVLGDGSIVILSNPLQLMPSAILPEQARDPSRAVRPAPVTGPVEPPAESAPAAEASAAAAAAGVAAPVAATPAAAPTAAEVIPIRPDIAVQPRAPLVLVVDDSLTVRKITTRLLEREGYRVLTAKDGLDALQVLADHTPNVILLDIEMPRMDGFEFARTIRSDDRQRGIPIIMITSRTADKHRMHAKELGVEEYLGKPYQDDQLLGLLAQYTGGVH